MVHWQNSTAYKDIKKFERESGFSYADYNRMNNPCYGQNQGVGAAIAMAVPSIFMTVMTKLAENSSNGGSGALDSDAAASRSAEEIKADIQAIFDKYKDENVTSVEDLEKLLKEKSKDTDINLENLEKNISKNTQVVDKKTARNQEIDAELANLAVLLGPTEQGYDAQMNVISEQIKQAEASGSNTSKLQAELEDLKYQKTQAEAKQKELEAEKTANTAEIEKAQKAMETDKATYSEFEAIQKDIKDLNFLSKELKKAEGTDVIETLVNDETANIKGLLDKIKNAKPEEKADLEKQLDEALKKYVQNPENKNPTYLNLAKTRGISK